MIPEPSLLELEPPRIERRARAGLITLAVFSLGHFFIDLYSAALGVFQPLLVEQHGLSLTQAGILGGVMVFASSVTQPLFGYWSDRYRTKMFSALAPAVAAVFISALGLAPGYGWLLVMVALGGAGVSSFHPQASARATAGLVTNRGRWMAVFISAGTLGLALGPLYFSFLVTRLGFEQTAWGMLPGVLVTVLLLGMLQDSPTRRDGARARFDWKPLQAVWRPLTVLYLLVFIRSIVQISFSQFLPLYLSRERGFTFSGASSALSLYLAAGALGGFVGGQLADRFGGRFVILISMLTSVPCLALFFLTTGSISMLGLALGGLTLLFTIPVNVVMAQELVPAQSGTVSALMMGFAWGMAGIIFIPLTGWAADHFSLHVALASQVAFPALGALLTLKLPK